MSQTDPKPKKDGIREILESGRFPSAIIKGTRKGNHANTTHDIRVPCANVAEGVRSPKEQEALYKKIVQEDRKEAKETARIRKSSRRHDGEIRKIATIPRELYESRKFEAQNKHYWQDEGKEALRKDHLLFED